ncbi:NAD(P)-binding protein [Tessaracoccus defluvii]|uniref:NAD(P)-binding protein n=1 Tax=Tessaracoccus defluvii TaxID=1285901 RepID=A0A7H0H789_9ACTN|nr:NAD(P)-binding protein [Tessaracoccus defluvii]
MSRVVVVGGGLAGTLAALRLLQAGHRVQLRESAAGLGGMIAPLGLADTLVDAGAEAYAVRGGVGRALCDELGLEVAGPAGAAHIWRPSGAYRMADGVVGIPATLADPALDALSRAGRATVAQEPGLGADVGVDASTVGALVRARLGEEALATLVEPVTRGCTPPQRTSFRWRVSRPACYRRCGSVGRCWRRWRPPAPPAPPSNSPSAACSGWSRSWSGACAGRAATCGVARVSRRSPATPPERC